MADYLPKLHALKAAGLSETIPIVVTQLTGWQREIINFLGLTERVVELKALYEHRCTIVEFDRVWLADGFSLNPSFSRLG
jgi:capsular polysaccharide biosynthesis protein